MCSQGYSSKAGRRLSILESRQKEMEVTMSAMAGQVTAVLTSTAANARAMEDLQAMFSKYLRNSNCGGQGSLSVSISAMETQGDTPPRSLPTADRGLLGLSPSNAPIISTESGLEGERRTEGAPPTIAKQEPKRATTEKGSAGSGSGDRNEAMAAAPLKKDAEVGDLEAKALIAGKGSNALEGPRSTKAGCGRKSDGPGRRKAPTPQVVGETTKKGAILGASQTEASMKTLVMKDSEGATRKMGSAVTEVQQDNLEEKNEDEEGTKKKSIPETSEDNDVYNMQALPSDAITNTSTAAVGAPSKQKLQLVPKKAKKQTGKIDARASEEEASTQVRRLESYPIRGSLIIAGSTKLLVFNVHGTLLDCSLLDERNPNTKMKASAYAAGRRIIF
jgi:hypothetical protein